MYMDRKNIVYLDFLSLCISTCFTILSCLLCKLSWEVTVHIYNIFVMLYWFVKFTYLQLLFIIIFEELRKTECYYLFFYLQWTNLDDLFTKNLRLAGYIIHRQSFRITLRLQKKSNLKNKQSLPIEIFLGFLFDHNMYHQSWLKDQRLSHVITISIAKLYSY